MAVVISQALVLSAALSPGSPDAPLIGWHNVVTAIGITADEEDADHPATNLANPSTALRWQGETTSEQYLTFAISGTDPIDYVGLARHNLGSGQIAVSVEIPDPEEPSEWIEIVEERLLARDDPAVLRFEPVHTTQIRLRLQPDTVAPRIAVVHVGKLLRLQRGLQPGLVPPTWAPADEVVDAVSESGDYLGSIVLRQSLATSVSIQWLDYDWWLANMREFYAHARARRPFFFAWLPASYPDEVGYAWSTADMRPEAHNLSHGIAVHLNLSMRAVVL